MSSGQKQGSRESEDGRSGQVRPNTDETACTDDAGFAVSVERAGGSTLLGRKSVLMGIAASVGAVIANVAQLASPAEAVSNPELLT